MESPPTLLPESPSFLPLKQLHHVFAPGRRRPCLLMFCDPWKASRDLEEEDDKRTENGTESTNHNNRPLSLLANKALPSVGIPRSVLVPIQPPSQNTTTATTTTTTTTTKQAGTQFKNTVSLLGGLLLVAIAFSGFQPGCSVYHHPSCYSTCNSYILTRVTSRHDNHRMLVCHKKNRSPQTIRRQRALRELWKNLANTEGIWWE